MLSYEGVTEVDLVRELWAHTRAVGVGINIERARAAAPPTDAECRAALRVTGSPSTTVYVDYLCGRPLKVELDTVRHTITSTWAYDRDAGGPGAAERALDACRNRPTPFGTGALSSSTADPRPH